MKTMTQPDTIKLLRECDAGIKMSTKSIDDVLEYAHDSTLRKRLTDGKNDNNALKGEIKELLEKYGDEGKEPNAMAKGMAHMKTGVKLSINESDATIADLITDGCNMGVKSLERYLNQYKAADEKSKDIAKRLIKLEDDLAISLRRFL